MTMNSNAVSINDIKAELDDGVVSVVFKKMDGTERTIVGTRMESAILPLENLSESDLADRRARHEVTKSESWIAIWDLDINEWRSFNLSQVVSAEILPDYVL